jgi:aspartyl-tRNA(Asn)/glutamyl-tRNA(Gln) amidotransferase subunit C
MDKQLLDKLMRMARLDLPETEQKEMSNDLDKICGWIEKLQEVDTEGVEPLTTLALEPPALREDAPQAPLNHEKALSSSKYSDSNYFRVPKVKDASKLVS